MATPSFQSADVDYYLVSPRHAFFFETDQAVREKIRGRIAALREGACLSDKQLIINAQDEPNITELHDGNATAIAWYIYALSTKVPRVFDGLARAFGSVVVLRNRRHPDGDMWHPYVPAQLACADRLMSVHDIEQGRTTRLAMSEAGDPVYFDDTRYFTGVDQAVPLRNVAKQLIASGLE